MLIICFYMVVAAPDLAVEEFKRTTLAKLAGVRCPSHGQAPRVEFQGAVLRDVRISIRTCCQSLSRLANNAIASPSR